MSRPRGTASSIGHVRIDLTQQESVPFWAGYRIHPDPNMMPPGVQLALAVLSPSLSLTERKHLAYVSDQYFMSWFAAGAMWYVIDGTVNSIRHT